MNHTKKVLRRYLGHEIRRLKCSQRSRKFFYQEMINNIEEFRQINPEASQKELYDFLGDPKQLVNNYLEQLSIEEVQRAQRKIKWKVAGFILLAALVLATVLFILWYKEFGNMTLVENPTIVTVYRSEI